MKPLTGDARRAAIVARRGRMGFALTMLLLGALTTIAVAWTCRWVVDEHLWTERQTQNLPAIPDAHPEWGLAQGVGTVSPGRDGRRFLRSRSRGDANLVGVVWIMVQAPDAGDDLDDTRRGARTPVMPPSPEAASWRAADPALVPWWSSVEAEPLTEHSARVESAAGWPFPALMARHRLPNEPVAWHPLQRASIGAVEGLPYDDERIVLLPTLPIAAGFAANTACFVVIWSIVVGGGVGVLTAVRRGLRRRRAQCVWCAHRQIAEGRDTCPECGHDPRRRPWPWRALIGTGGALAVILGAALVIVFVAVRQHPVVPPLMQAAYDGKIADLERRAAAAPSGLALAEDAALLPRSDMLMPRMRQPPPARAVGVWCAAAFGEQIESLRAIAAIEGHPAPPAGAPMSRALFEDLCFIAPYCRPGFLADVFDAFGWSVVSTTGPSSLVMSERQTRFVTPRGWHDELLVRMRRDPDFHAMFWPSYVRCFIQYGSTAVARTAMQVGPPARLSAADRASLLAYCRQAGRAGLLGLSGGEGTADERRELYDALCTLLESAP